MLQLRWALIASLLLGACSLPASQADVTSVRLSAQADCSRAEGVWRTALDFCEYTSGCR
jgi:hypothetical protein